MSWADQTHTWTRCTWETPGIERNVELGNHFDLFPIPRTTAMVHEVHTWDSDSDYVDDDDEHDELDQDPLMVIKDRVKPAELKEMTVADICRTSRCFTVAWGHPSDSRQSSYEMA